MYVLLQTISILHEIRQNSARHRLHSGPDLLPASPCPQQDLPTPELLSDFRDLRTDLIRQGLYSSSKLFYTYKSLTTFTIVLLAWATVSASSSWAAVFLSAALLGLFQQQIGWLAHDVLHHQVRFVSDQNDSYPIRTICTRYCARYTWHLIPFHLRHWMKNEYQPA